MGQPERRSRSEMIEETTGRLLAVARAAFAERGFAAVSLDALAAEAGVTRGAIHHHFKDKAGLFEAVLRQVDAELEAAMDAEHARHADGWTAFVECSARYLDEASHPSRRRILFEDACSVLGPKANAILVVSAVEPIHEELRHLIAAGALRIPDAEALTHILNGAVFDLALWAAEAPEERLPRARATLRATLEALRA